MRSCVKGSPNRKADTHCSTACSLPSDASCSGPAELLVTEAAHVRMLRVLHDLFYQPMADGGFFPLEELQNIFPSLDELIEVHCECQPPLPLLHILAGLIYPEPTHPLSTCPRQPGLLLGTTHFCPPQHTLQRYRHTKQAHEMCMTAHQPQGSNTQLQPEPAAAQTRHFSLSGSSKAPLFLHPTALFLDCLMKRRQESGYLIEEIGDVLLARVRCPTWPWTLTLHPTYHRDLGPRPVLP